MSAPYRRLSWRPEPEPSPEVQREHAGRSGMYGDEYDRDHDGDRCEEEEGER